MPIILDPPPPPTPAPDPGPLPSAADRLYARLEPVAYADEDLGYPLKDLTGALMAPRQVIDDIVIETNDEISWSAVLDPDRIPAVGQLLEWLALFPGVELPPSALTVEEKRDRIKAAAGFYRGTPRAMRETVAITLTGTKTVRLVERVNDNAYWIMVVTSPAETPDSAATHRAALSQKPAGHRLDYYTDADALIDEGTVTIDSVGDAVTIDTVTLADVT